MRVCIAEERVRKGNLVHLSASLPKNMQRAFFEVFVEMPGGEPSPYVAMYKMALVNKSAPTMHNATTFRLSPALRKQSIELVADDNCRFLLMQDIDVKGDQLAKGKVYVYHRNVFARALGWLLRGAKWPIRSFHAYRNSA